MEARSTKILTHLPFDARVLILRFSSIGDLFQCYPAAKTLSASGQIRLDWVVRSDLAATLEPAQHAGWIKTIYAHPRDRGLSGLIQLAWRLRAQRYTHIYDAHASLRSRILLLLLWRPGQQKVLTRQKNRIRRFLLLKLKIKKVLGRETFAFPFPAKQSYLTPLLRWGLTPVALTAEDRYQLLLPQSQTDQQAVAILVPGSAWELKNWAASHWIQLLKHIAKNPSTARSLAHKWILLGGPNDSICDVIFNALSPNEVQALHLENLKGKLSLSGSIQKIGQSQLVIGTDTGWIHWADCLALKTIALQGPSAFGGIFGPNSRNLLCEPRLPCQPCTKDGSGRCKQTPVQKCLHELSPERVWTEITQLALTHP